MRPRRAPSRALLAILLGLSIAALATALPGDRGAQGHAARPSSPAELERPRLVLLVVLDQFRADYLARFAPSFGAGGFRRLLDRGAVYPSARYPHATTSTCPGHATIVTGGYADQHGIVGNHWIDRASGAARSAIDDPAERTLVLGGARPPGASPRSLRLATVFDELAMVRPASRIVSVAMKDDAAVLMGGRKGRAYFWEPAAGGFTTSTYYAPRLPAWVDAWNAARPADAFRAAGWPRLLPEAAYADCAPDDRPEEHADPPLGRVFPHPLSAPGLSDEDYLENLRRTPFGNTLTRDFALAALRAEGLGARAGVTDILAVGFSATDSVGHCFGMESHEMLDAVARLDRDVAALLDGVEAAVGPGRTLVVVTADHGMCPTVETSAAHGLSAGRIDPHDLERAVEEALSAAFPGCGAHARFVNPGVYIETRTRPAAEEVERVAAEATRAVPGIAQAFRRSDLLRGVAPPTAIGRAVTLAFDPERSGDVVVVARPFWYLDEEKYEDCATHGSPYGGEQHVPLILFGSGVAPGRYERAVSPADLAPTVARILGDARPAGAEGEVLVEAVAAPW